VRQALITDTPSSALAGTGGFLLSTVGTLDTCSFLGVWLGVRVLQQCSEAIESRLFGLFDGASSGADEGLRNGMHQLIEVLGGTSAI
jgi:hypothetical protein